jgi:cathepsin F
VFTANLRRARRHQRLDPSAVHGVTKFSDLTPDEFRDRFLGLRKSRRAPLLGSAHDALTLPTDGLPTEFDWREKGAVGPVKDQVRPPPIRSRIRSANPSLWTRRVYRRF